MSTVTNRMHITMALTAKKLADDDDLFDRLPLVDVGRDDVRAREVLEVVRVVRVLLAVRRCHNRLCRTGRLRLRRAASGLRLAGVGSARTKHYTYRRATGQQCDHR
jgi:hypothetical protein